MNPETNWLTVVTSFFASFWRRVALAVRSQVRDDSGWETISRAGTGPQDRDWHEKFQDLEDALEAWRKNFLIRQVVRLTTAYVVGDGFEVRATHFWIMSFVRRFWNHEKNHIDDRLPAWCDELTRSGELFIVLFTNPIDGMSYVREIPASSITRVITDDNDYETEIGFEEQVINQVETRAWRSKHTAINGEPILLHYKINRVIGATRGESDVSPILPWAKRYSKWLRGRVELNDLRRKMSAVVITVADNLVKKKEADYRENPPTDGAVVVKGRGENIEFPSANIRGIDASPDGRAIRLAIAAGGNIPLHFLGEGSSATQSTASEMGDPTHRHYRMRQKDFIAILKDVIKQAYRRKLAFVGGREPADYGLTIDAPDISRADNTELANAAKTIVEAFAIMKAEGWVDDETAIRLSFKFAGEILSDEKIKEILNNEQKEERSDGQE